MRDPSLEAYVEAIERLFRARRGAEHVLTPRDFALARSWYEARVPLATVLAGMDRAFESASDISSLAFCRPRVEELISAHSAPQSLPPSPLVSMPLAALATLLEALLDRLQELRPGPQACFEPALRQVEELREQISLAGAPNWDVLRESLRRADDVVAAAALRALSSEEREAFRAEAARAAARYRGRMEQSALEQARDRYVVQRAREKLGLPSLNPP